MFRWLSAFIFLVGSLTAVAAQDASTENSIAHCFQIGDDARRLACYDQIADGLTGASIQWDGEANSTSPGASASPTTTGFQPTGIGEWALRQAQTPEGGTDIALALFTTGRKSSGSGGGLRVALWVHCSAGTTLFYIDWNETVQSSTIQGIKIETRIDAGAPEEHYWARYTNHNVTGPFSERTSISLIRDLFGGSVLHAKLNEPDSAYSASFNVSGLEQAITPVRQACDW